MTCKQPKLIFCGTRNKHSFKLLDTTKSENQSASRDNHTTRFLKTKATGQVKKHYDNKIVHKSKDRCNKCGNSTHVQGLHCPAQKYQCKVCHKYGNFSSLCYQRKKQAHHKSNLSNPKAHQLKAGPVYVHDSSICGYSKESSSNESFCL